MQSTVTKRPILDLKTIYLYEPIEGIGFEDFFLREGIVTSYNGTNLVSPLSVPFTTKMETLDCNPVLTGFIYGRSGFFDVAGETYKQKGINPTVVNGKVINYDEGWLWREPHGTQLGKQARRELRANGLVDQQLHEYGYLGPLVPIADVELDMSFPRRLSFLGDSNVHATRYKCRGDSRLNHCINITERIMIDQRKSKRSVAAKEVFIALMAWSGFSYHVLYEAGIIPDEDSNVAVNFAVYKMQKGYGVSRVDLEWSKEGQSKKLIRKRAREFYDRASTWSVRSVARRFGTESYKIDDAFLQGLNGKIPEPINTDLIHQVFRW